MEFAAGNYGLVESAYDYAMDTTPPNVGIEYSAQQTGGDPINFRFDWLDEAAVIHYTTDGSTPTLASPTYNAQRARSVGEVLTLSSLGAHTVKWIAVDIKGNVSEVKSQRLLVGLDEADGTVGGDVHATLSLSLGADATFGAFTPGVEKDYDASTTATVISTAGDATLSVSDPGHLMNGTFAMPEPLQVSFSKSTWTGPTSNEDVTISFKQHVNETDALRTGAYSKTLTFTLSTTQP
jgi:hypothetical protein